MATKNAILAELKKGVLLTQWDVSRKDTPQRLRTTRLGAIIFELRKHHVIETIRKPNRHNKGTHAVYRYVGPKTDWQKSGPTKAQSKKCQLATELSNELAVMVYEFGAWDYAMNKEKLVLAMRAKVNEVVGCAQD